MIAAADSGASQPEIRRAKQSDLGRIQQLLTANALPTTGVGESLQYFLVATQNDAVVGAIGLEPFGESALLRSAVVDESIRGTGLGAKLVHRVIALADQMGAHNIFLLTTTAESYFRRFGFVQSTRDAAPPTMRNSAEFRGACPASAIAMVRTEKSASRGTQREANGTA
jgi:N-acetylglutamate synthase-like GNAT family acetyltransferase